MFTTIYIDSKLKLTQNILNIKEKLLKKYNSSKIITYNKYHEISDEIFLPVIENSNYNYLNYKNNILINRNKSIFIKKGANLIVKDIDTEFESMQIWKERGYEVYNLKLGQNCNLGCKYCYLLSSNKMYPELAIYGNLPEEVEKFLKKNKDKKILFNIGEHTDSFLLDSITQYSLFLYSLLDKYPNLVIESRTKLINLYLLFPPHERFILSFSISINNLDLFGETKKVFQKLDYIKKITFDGYNVALKFDPIISIDLYEDEFFSKIFQIKNENIDHFSIGTLRFSRNLQIITEYVYNFKINLKDFEFINGKYVVKNREKIYNFFLGKLKPLNKDFYISMNPIINKPNI